jgi:redox-sensitive bicupin YhaK (pirin superfamily)
MLHCTHLQWINVPSAKKMTDPAYGTVPADKIPVHKADGATIRVLAGEFNPLDGVAVVGPFETRVATLMMDVVLEPGATFAHDLPGVLDNCIIYAYGPAGHGVVGEGDSASPIEHGSAARLDATGAERRRVEITAGGDGLSFLVFAGTRLNQGVAWHGPFVMTTDEEIKSTIQE